MADAARQKNRQRLLERGAGELGDAELLAVLLDRTRDGLPAADGLLASSGGLKPLLVQEGLALAKMPGMGPGKAARLLAAVELGRRVQRERERRPKLKTPGEVFRHLAPNLSALRRECFHVLSFNSRNVLLRDTRVAEGTSHSCPVDPREVFRAALQAGAVGVVLAHNHPSGDAEPSTQDVALTRQLMQGGALLGISVLDHIVVGDGCFVSLLQRGLMCQAPRGI